MPAPVDQPGKHDPAPDLHIIPAMEEWISEHSLVVPQSSNGERLDVFLKSALDEFSRSYLQKLISQGCITLNGVVPKPAKSVHTGDDIDVRVPPPVELRADPENIPLEVLFEDSDIIVINKAAGMVVHPACGHLSGTLVNALLFHCAGKLSGINGVLRPGIVHRLDAGTSGVMVCAKSDVAHRSLVDQFKGRSVDKRYFAIVHGPVSPELHRIEAPIGRHRSDFRRMAVREDVGKAAVTEIVSSFPYDEFSAVHLHILTGRTHQIRVHMKYRGHPLLCDETYGAEASFPSDNPVISRVCLHAYRLSFDHPVTRHRLCFNARIPDDIKSALALIRGRNKA
ncbi:MAG: RluA family pseudouridine synthase [Candidatus Brocadiia bacterium]